MYDKFEPFRKVQKGNFVFEPIRFEVWIGGKLVKQGRTNAPIVAQAASSKDSSGEKVVVAMDDNSLFPEVSEFNVFDEFVTAVDRLQLVTVPAKTNNSNMGIMAMQQLIGPTRAEMNFASNQPYCCNLFLVKGKIAKVTFSFSNPEKLVEFHSTDEPENIEPNEFQKMAEMIRKAQEK